jgi:NADH-quinone oxidoreductase subunit E
MPDATTPQFSPEQLAEVRRLQGLYPDRRGALLPVLHMAQDTYGYISLEIEEYVGKLFDLTPAPSTPGWGSSTSAASTCSRGACSARR